MGAVKRGRTKTTRQEDRGPPRISSAKAGEAASRQLNGSPLGQPVVTSAWRIKVGDLLDDLERDYRMNGRELRAATWNLARLREAFGLRAAVELTTADLRAYITARQDGPEALSNATLNRDLALLRRAYRLAMEGGRLLSRPHVPRLKEAAPRKGFFEPEQFEAVRRHLPEALRPVVTFAYLTGWRMPSEVLPLTWAQVDFRAGAVRLDPHHEERRGPDLSLHSRAAGAPRGPTGDDRGPPAADRASSRGCSIGGDAPSRISGGPGRAPASSRAAPAASLTTSGGRPSGTWSEPVCLSG